MRFRLQGLWSTLAKRHCLTVVAAGSIVVPEGTDDVLGHAGYLSARLNLARRWIAEVAARLSGLPSRPALAVRPAGSAEVSGAQGRVPLTLGGRPGQCAASPATANSRYGTTLTNSAATAMCAHSHPERGIASRRVRTMANNTIAPRASRAKVTSTAEKPRSASLIHKNADPQISVRMRAFPSSRYHGWSAIAEPPLPRLSTVSRSAR